MPHNIRAPQMWEIIKSHVDWTGKRVLDLGCGRGDMCRFVSSVAASVIAVDNDTKIIAGNVSSNNCDTLTFAVMDIENYVWDIERGAYDVMFCFSVIPYLVDQVAFMLNVGEVAPLLFVEIQMKGDGPGTMTKSEIKAMLGNHYENVEEIGHTVVEGRNTQRPIWKCWND